MKTSDVVLGMGVLAVCVSATIIGAALFPAHILMTISGIAAILLALVAVRNIRMLEHSAQSRNAIAAGTARSMSYIWFWGALSMGAIYMFIVPPWREWVVFTLAFAAAGLACIFFARVHTRDAESVNSDDTMLKLGRYLAIGQLVGTLLTLIGLLVDPNKTFTDMKDPAWAANIIFFAGAAGLAIVSAYAVKSQSASALQ